MRKIALLLVLALTVSVLASAAAVAPVDVLGTWYLNTFTFEGVSATIEGDYRIELNRDKSAVVVLGGTEQTTTWKLTDSGADVQIGDYSTSFDLQEDGSLKANLTIGDEYTHDCFFVREQPEPAELPEAVDAASEDEYFGTYVITLQKTGGILIPVENGAESLTVKIEFAQVTLSGSGVRSSSELVVMSDYKDNKVVIPADDIISGASEGNILTIGKTNTGIMATCDIAPDTVYYLSPADASGASEAAETADTAEGGE